MKKLITTTFFITTHCFILIMFSCNSQQRTEQQNFATATITGTKPDTAVSGMAQFTENNNKVTMDLQLTIPSKANQTLAVHIHENGDCSQFGVAAGGHWNPTQQMHGRWGSDSFHAGDIGNINLDANGNGSMHLETNLWSIGSDQQTDILNKSLVVHSGADDYISQPSGNSGDRIGCGIIRKTDK